MSLEPVRVAIFPSAGSVHLYRALDEGVFEAEGLAVDLHEVRSSDEQMQLWDSGAVDVMHTAIDHLLRPRQRDPVTVRAEGIGELAVYARPGLEPDRARWAVDGPFSAFSFVLQAVIADLAGHVVATEQLVPIGGTKQRFEALREGSTDGTTLHAPFDALADQAGFERVGGHRDVAPDLVPVVAVTARADADTPKIDRYLRACAESVRALLDEGSEGIRAALERRGFPAAAAAAAAPQLLGPVGLQLPPSVDLSGLLASVALRERFVPSGSIDRRDLDRLLVSRGSS